MQSNPVGAESWAWIGGWLLLSVVLAVVGHALLYRVFWRIARRSATVVDDAILRHTCGPTRVLLPLIAFSATLDAIGRPAPELAVIHQITVIAVIAAVAWTIVGLIAAAREIVETRYRIDVPDNLAARRIRTQVEVLQRIAVSAVAIVALAAALMSFPSVRQLGLSLFASAGVAGLVLGVAARPTLGNMIAGLQIAMSQPIRIDDVVVVENEFGRVEEITMTYVILRLWDERRMIVPLTWFIEKPFTNWTRTGSSLLATVYLWVDYGVDVDAVRAELDRIVRSTDLWDRRVVALHVTDVTEHAVQLRALVSASNSGVAFDLRCFIRERLVAFLRQRRQALAGVRAEQEEEVVDPPARRTASAASDAADSRLPGAAR
jgi:small-conductance mechanosensitive channel